RAPGSLASRRVAVETEHDLVGKPQQLRHMHWCRRSAERGDRIAHLELRERHHVHVALDYKHMALGSDRIARLDESVELAPLFEERRLRRVQVLGLAVA